MHVITLQYFFPLFASRSLLSIILSNFFSSVDSLDVIFLSKSRNKMNSMLTDNFNCKSLCLKKFDYIDFVHQLFWYVYENEKITFRHKNRKRSQILRKYKKYPFFGIQLETNLEC